MDDIVPQLYKKILSEFNSQVKKDAWIKEFEGRVNKGTATQEEVDKYSQALGQYASKALRDGFSSENLPDGKIYWNIAKRIVEPLLRKVTDMVNNEMVKVISSEHSKIRLGTKPVKAPFNQDRCDAIMNKIVNMSLGVGNDGRGTEQEP